MSDIVIQAENLGKKYTIGHQTERGRYVALRDVLAQNARSLWRTTADLLRGRPIIQGNHLEEVWALKDVSFEIRRGETVGIIGRNGAGKSTLLKVLSRITEPSAGRVTIKGRVASLLEVGTGFHPELTGRENVYLNGAILGMTRAEVKRKFDEIVAFAEIEKFLDTPVKRYSSGMYVRLAFAVAAHLEPEILLVDEVLAVGDASFQKKCLGKMGEVASEGRTVLFVSHDMAAISGLCEQVLVLEKGSIASIAQPTQAIQTYLNSFSFDRQFNLPSHNAKGAIKLTSFYCEVSSSGRTDHLVAGLPVRLVLGYESLESYEVKNVGVSIVVYTAEGVQLTNLWNEYMDGQTFDLVPQYGEFVCEIPKLPLRAGRYLVDVYCEVNGEVSDWIHQAGVFNVTDGDYYGSGKISRYSKGCVFLEHTWTVRL